MNPRDNSSASPILLGVLRRALARARPEVALDAAPASGRVSIANVHAAWRAAEAQLGADIGLITARELHVGDIDPQGYVINAAGTLGEALNLTCRYHRLVYGNVVVHAEHDADQAALRFALLDDSDVPHSLIEFAVAALYRMARFVFGPFPLTEVRFRHVSAATPQAFLHTFDCPVRQGADATVIVLPANALSLPNAAADHAVSNILADRLHRELSMLTFDGGLGARVYALLVQELPLRGTAAVDVARELNMSERTLRRRLADEGTSHRLLLEDARREVAIRLLGEQRLSIDEVAYHLGYAQPSSFQRAFKRWTGMPPATFRVRCGRASTLPPRAPQSKTTVLLP